MDEMKIVSKFTTNMISKLVKMVLRKRRGKTHVHLDVDAELEKEELVKILKKIGLG